MSPRYLHLEGQNPYVLARDDSASAAEASDTGQVPVVVVGRAGPEEPVQASEARLVRSSAIVAAGTLLSRLTGLVRVVALTYAVGSLALADAYNLANTTPNIVYELLLGGVLSATLVPVFVDRFEHDDDDAVSAVVTTATATLLVLTVAGVLLAPAIFSVYGRPDLAPAGVPLLRLLLPQMLFYGFDAMGSAVLNAKRRFAVAAFNPVANNVVASAALIWFGATVKSNDLSAVTTSRGAMWLLGAGTTAGIVAMSIPLFPAIKRAGVRLRWRLDPRNVAVRQVLGRAGWTLGYVAANQIGLTIVLRIAAAADTGVVSSYTYAFIFFQLPHGLVAVSIMTTFIPELASAWGREDVARFRDRFGSGLRLLWTGIVPAAAGYAVVAHPLIRLLLQRGHFDAGAADSAGDVLITMTLGLPGFSGYLFALRGFYAQGDTKTPFLLNIVENVLQVGLTALLVATMSSPFVALGLAYAGAYSIAAVVALVVLHRRVGRVLDARLTGTVARLALAGAAMVAAMLVVRGAVVPDSAPDLVSVPAEIVAGGVVFVAAALALRVRELRDLVTAVTGRASRARGADARA